MKKMTIWTIAILMFVSIIALIGAEFYYFHQVQDMRRKQFDENVQRALYQVAHGMELREVQARLESELDAEADSTGHAGFDEQMGLRAQETRRRIAPTHMPFARPNPIRFNAFGNTDIRANLQRRYLKQKHLINEVIYANLYRPDGKTLEERLDRGVLDLALKNELQHNGIDLHQVHYHFKVSTVDGREVMRCQDYAEHYGDAVFRQVLFGEDSPSQAGMLEVRFPDLGSYLFREIAFIFPLVFFSLVILVISVITLVAIAREKRLSQVKTDFINNMAHELKTPIASISLVAQMLSDRDLHPSEERLRELHGILGSETRRLLMLAQKVQQIAMFDGADALHFKFDEVEANTVVEEAVMTFELKVKEVSPDGVIEAHLDAEDPIISADQIHFRNLVNNILENALKYRRPEVPVHLSVSTSNKNNMFVITFADNGIGIRKEEQKRIFDRFYRVSSGNVHNVKGTGIGLAYVAGVVKAHHGTITVDSTYGRGTTFIVSFPLMEA